MASPSQKGSEFNLSHTAVWLHSNSSSIAAPNPPALLAQPEPEHPSNGRSHLVCWDGLSGLACTYNSTGGFRNIFQQRPFSTQQPSEAGGSDREDVSNTRRRGTSPLFRFPTEKHHSITRIEPNPAAFEACPTPAALAIGLTAGRGCPSGMDRAREILASFVVAARGGRRRGGLAPCCLSRGCQAVARGKRSGGVRECGEDRERVRQKRDGDAGDKVGEVGVLADCVLGSVLGFEDAQEPLLEAGIVSTI
jgi:hypothetical protein